MSQDIRGVNNRGRNIIHACFNNVVSSPFILGRKLHAEYEKLTTERERYRFICDYLASMNNQQIDEFYARYI